MATVAGQVVASFGQVVQALDQTADRFTGFNAELTQAQAMADLREVLGDIRRAQDIGPDLARFVRARSDTQQQLEDTKIALLKEVVPVVVTGLKLIQYAVKQAETGATLAGTAWDVFTRGILPSSNTILAVGDALLDYLNGLRASENDPSDVVMGSGILVPLAASEPGEL